MLVLGVLCAELFFSRVSLLVLLAGLILLFQGWTFFRAVLFPWAFLILMVPIPSLILQQVTFPLQLLASKLATLLLELVGVPVLRQGNVIVLESPAGFQHLSDAGTLPPINAAYKFTQNGLQ